MMKYCTKWLLYPVPIIVLSGIWYFYSIPEMVRVTIFGMNAQVEPAAAIFIISSVLLFVLGLYFSLKTNVTIQKVMLFVLLLIGQSWYACFVCHKEEMEDPVHHENMMREFRNKQIIQ